MAWPGSSLKILTFSSVHYHGRLTGAGEVVGWAAYQNFDHRRMKAVRGWVGPMATMKTTSMAANSISQYIKYITTPTLSGWSYFAQDSLGPMYKWLEVSRSGDVRTKNTTEATEGWVVGRTITVNANDPQLHDLILDVGEQERKTII